MGMATTIDTSSMLASATTEVEYVARALAVRNFLLIAPGTGNTVDLAWVASEVEIGWTQFQGEALSAIDAIDQWRAK
jgi:hypothetical protein